MFLLQEEGRQHSGWQGQLSDYTYSWAQEESLLDSFLDWSLDSCSGYEGEQESEGERDEDGKAFSLIKKQMRELKICLFIFA